MKRYISSTTIPFSPKQMYDLVVDMDRYPEFIPWLVRSIKSNIQQDRFMSEMTFSFKGFRETFHTEDRVIPDQSIHIKLVSGPFENLTSEWRFIPIHEGTRIEFFIEFSFKNRLLDLTLGPLFGEASKRMVDAFKQRAMEMYQQ